MTAPRGTDYAELQVTTHFSFLRGASSVEELFAEAASLGNPARSASPIATASPASSVRMKQLRSRGFG